MLDMWPYLLCIGTIAMLLVIPAWSYILWRDWWARRARDAAIRAGRHQPVTIVPHVDPAKCIGSGSCVRACPEDVLTIIAGQAQAVNASACVGHGACVASCPTNAIELFFGSERRGVDVPELGSDFQTVVPGLYIAGELGGMGLIANAIEQGRQAANNVAKGMKRGGDMLDVVIVGAGPAGLSAAVTAGQLGLRYALLEQGEFGGAIRHYPRQKLVMTRPMDVPGFGRVTKRTLLKEELIAMFEQVVNNNGIQVQAGTRVEGLTRLQGGGFEVSHSRGKVASKAVLLAVGRRGTPRRLGVPGEELEKVTYTLIDPDLYAGARVLVVGGGDSAVEAACSLAKRRGTTVTLAYRGDQLTRPRRQNQDRLKRAVDARAVHLMTQTSVSRISSGEVELSGGGRSMKLPNDIVIVCAGGVLPYGMLRDAGVRIKRHFGQRIEDAEEPAPSNPAPPPSRPRPPVRPSTGRGRPKRARTPTPPPPGRRDTPTGGGLERAYTQEELNRLVQQAMEEDDLLQEHSGPISEFQQSSADDTAIHDKLALVLATFSQPNEHTDPLLQEYLDSDFGNTDPGPMGDDPTVWLTTLPAADWADEVDGDPLVDARLKRQKGQSAAALELFISAADGQLTAPAKVLEIVGEALPLALGEQVQSPLDRASYLGRLWWLWGQAHMAMDDWADAAVALEKALEQGAISPDKDWIGRCLDALCRCYHRTGELGQAQAVLAEAAPGAQSDVGGRASRAMADIHLRRGEVEKARSLWQEARSRSVGADFEARALVGLARCARSAGDLVKCDQLLAEAGRVAKHQASFSTVIEVTLAQIATDNAMGWYRPALHRGEELLDTDGAQPYLSRICAVLGTTLVSLGMKDEALDAVEVGVEAIPKAPRWDWQPRVDLARLLVEVGKPKRAEKILAGIDVRAPCAETNPDAEILAVRARIAAPTDPEGAQKLARQALQAPHPLDVSRLARVALDCARAHVAAGAPSHARSAAKVGLGAAKQGGEGLRLELLLALQAAKPESRVLDAIAATARRIRKRTPAHAADSFSARPVIAKTLKR